MTETMQKLVHDLATGKLEYVDLTPTEIAEVEAKQVAVRAQQEAEVAVETAKAEEVAADQAVIDAQPTDDEINGAKSYADLKPLVLRLNAIVTVLLKNRGQAS